MKKGKSFTISVLGVVLTTILFSQGSGYLSQKLMVENNICLLYTSPSPRDRTRSRMPSSA